VRNGNGYNKIIIHMDSILFNWGFGDFLYFCIKEMYFLMVKIDGFLDRDCKFIPLLNFLLLFSDKFIIDFLLK
jgi:hypothetical protein